MLNINFSPFECLCGDEKELFAHFGMSEWERRENVGFVKSAFLILFDW